MFKVIFFNPSVALEHEQFVCSDIYVSFIVTYFQIFCVSCKISLNQSFILRQVNKSIWLFYPLSLLLLRDDVFLSCTWFNKVSSFDQTCFVFLYDSLYTENKTFRQKLKTDTCSINVAKIKLKHKQDVKKMVLHFVKL